MVGWVPSITSISDVDHKNISLDTSYQEPALLLGFCRYAGGQRVAAGHHYHSATFLTSAPHVTIRQFRVICPVVLRQTASDYRYL